MASSQVLLFSSYFIIYTTSNGRYKITGARHLAKSISQQGCSLLIEEEIKEFAMLKSYKREIKSSIYEKDSKRANIKKLINQLPELIPNVRSNIYASMTNTQREYLPNEKY